MTDREEFERWNEYEHPELEHFDDCYWYNRAVPLYECDCGVRHAFNAGWQAARRWIPVSEMPKGFHGRIITYTPGAPSFYAFREMDAKFLRTCKDATHYKPLYPPETEHSFACASLDGEIVYQESNVAGPVETRPDPPEDE